MIRHILFDLDSTLYSARWGLEEDFSRRLRQYTSSLLGLPWEKCEPFWKDALKRHGTTLEWLITEKGFTAVDDYFAFMHPENEADSLPPDPELRRFLENLPCPCSILTNSPGFHADRIIKKLGIEGVFRQVFAVDADGLKGKPHADAFNRALDALGLKPEDALFVDDIPRYVGGYIAIGGRGILFDEKDIHRHFPYDRIKDLKELTRFFD